MEDVYVRRCHNDRSSRSPHIVISNAALCVWSRDHLKIQCAHYIHICMGVNNGESASYMIEEMRPSSGHRYE